jgi:hypothetical protein
LPAVSGWPLDPGGKFQLRSVNADAPPPSSIGAGGFAVTSSHSVSIRRSAVGFTLAALLLTSSASAQSVGERLVVLKMDLAARAYWLENLDGTTVSSRGHQQGASLKPSNDVFLRKRNLARLVVAKANPLAYGYTSEAKPLTDTSDFTAISGFGPVVAALVKALGGPAASPLSVRVTDEEGLDERETALDAILREHGIGGTPGLKAFLDALQQQIDALDAKVKTMPALFTRSKTEQTEVRLAVCGSETKCSWGLVEIGKAIEDGFAKVRELRQALRADARFVTEASILRDMLDEEAVALKALATARAFAAAAARIDRDLPLADEAPYIASKNRPIVVTRTELTLAGEPTKQATSHTFVFKPDSPVTYAVGGDYVYSFVRRPTFSAEKQGEQLVIVETPSPDYVGQKVGSVLSIAPTRWVDTPFTPVFELGINTKTEDSKDNVGFLLGVGFSPFSVFHFGGGVAFEQVPSLDGQKVGDAVASSDAIKQKLNFTRGWFLHASMVKKLGS